MKSPIILSLEFEPLFAMITESRYAKHYVFKDGLTQLSALRDNLRDEEGFVHHEFDDHDDNQIGSLNPCDYNFFLTGIRIHKRKLLMYAFM